MIRYDTNLKTYNYLSRYQNQRTLYNNKDKKRYYETYTPLSKKIDRYIIHKVDEMDNLDKLSLKYYGTPLYWWIIADINNIEDVFNLRKGQELIVPYLNEIAIGE